MARLLLVMEHCPGGSLEALIERGETARWDEREQRRAARHVASGLAFLHGQWPPIAHRDLKPANVLRGERGNLKLADLGASRACYDESLMTHGVGTQLSAAPEQIGLRPYSHAVDLWAYGCVLACLARHSPVPYDRETSRASTFFVDVSRGALRPAVPPVVTAKAYEGTVDPTPATHAILTVLEAGETVYQADNLPKTF